MRFWEIVFLISAAVGVIAYYRFFSRGMDESGKRLTMQKLAMPCFLLVLLAIQFLQPDYAYYIDTSLEHVNTVEDARSALKNTNETMERFVQDVKYRDNVLQILLIIGAGLVVSSLFGANTDKNDRSFADEEKPISIFDNDNNK